ncbi:MAG: sigma-70 family RNA polymerase sigma factor [Planctomycetes bacterium]|nr:sigma-70 family RNA polymerase sigma factor [Planctomycetota bacterium]
MAGDRRGSFLTTRWSLLVREDLGEVFTLYWRPVYLHLRRRGHDIEAAKDLTQGFFVRFLEKGYARQADRARGRFRHFLRAAVDHFAADAHDRSQAKKRGGGRKAVPLDVESAESMLVVEDPVERHFDRQWARAILDDAMAALEQEFAARGQGARFAEFRPVLAGGTHKDRVALHRARKRFRELVRERVARTVESANLVDEELAALLKAL